MQRPLIMRAAPLAWRVRLFYRHDRARCANSQALYASAALHHARDVRMQLSPTDEGHGCIALTGVYELDCSKLADNIRRNGLAARIDVHQPADRTIDVQVQRLDAGWPVERRIDVLNPRRGLVAYAVWPRGQARADRDGGAP